MIAIIGAMEIEVETIKQEMDIKEVINISSTDYYVGTIAGKDVVVGRCNPGKVNAAQAAQAAIMAFSPSLLINPGVAGGIADGVEIGDLVVAKSCCQHDYDLTAFGEKMGMVQTALGNIEYFDSDEKFVDIFAKFAEEFYDGKVHKGIVASGDAFVADSVKCKEISKEFNADACDMESGSIAQVCFLSKCPFIALRSISDNANHSGKVDFVSFAKDSAYKISKLVKKLFETEAV